MTNRICLFDDRGAASLLDASQPGRASYVEHVLARIPALLGDGDTHDAGALLVRSFAPVLEGSDGRWSLDQLYLDRLGIPTIVTIREGLDGRSRREVIGQILEFAANGAADWTADSIRAMFDDTCDDARIDPASCLRRFLRDDGDESARAFWHLVDSNLDAGRIRLVVVADSIPRELRRTIELLAEQMEPTELLGVELPAFVRGGTRLVVPGFVGRTSRSSRHAMSTRVEPRSAWDLMSFFASAETRLWPSEVEALRALHDFVAPIAELAWSDRADSASFSVRFRQLDSHRAPLFVRADGALGFRLDRLDDGPRSRRFATLLSKELRGGEMHLEVTTDAPALVEIDAWSGHVTALCTALRRALSKLDKPARK